MSSSFDGTLVHYQGRLTDEHGVYHATICDCGRCTAHYRLCEHCKTGDYGACADGFIYKLTDPDDGGHVLLNAQHKHLTPATTPAYPLAPDPTRRRPAWPSPSTSTRSRPSPTAPTPTRSTSPTARAT